MAVTQQTFEQVVLEDPWRQWELHQGHLREKPPMTAAHNRSMFRLGLQLGRQLDPTEFDVRVNAGRLRRTEETAYIPDVVVIPASLVRPILDRTDLLEEYPEALPFVAEVWSPSTGQYDVDSKLPEYQRRGDYEIWRLHPFERSLIAWRRRPDGGYDRSEYQGGTVELVTLPGVRNDLEVNFA